MGYINSNTIMHMVLLHSRCQVNAWWHSDFAKLSYRTKVGGRLGWVGRGKVVVGKWRQLCLSNSKKKDLKLFYPKYILFGGS